VRIALVAHDDQRMKSGPLGGDRQIGALMRLAIVYDIAMALNKAIAEIVLAMVEQRKTT
jgi:methylglyoxal synthase